MTRGAQRDRNREKAQARADKNSKAEGKSSFTPGGVNVNALALQEKIKKKEEMKAAGLITDEPKKVKEAPKNMINPHTGKRDPEYTKAQLIKQGIKP